ncbi:hypothetical protein J3F84DRAFT_280981 [Trichoderma pleuroticola]
MSLDYLRQDPRRDRHSLRTGVEIEPEQQKPTVGRSCNLRLDASCHLTNNIVPATALQRNSKFATKARQQGTANYQVRKFFFFFIVSKYLLGLPVSRKSAGLLQGSNWMRMLLGSWFVLQELLAGCSHEVRCQADERFSPQESS